MTPSSRSRIWSSTSRSPARARRCRRSTVSSFTSTEGETLALVGEVGLGQDHGRPLRPRPDRADAAAPIRFDGQADRSAAATSARGSCAASMQLVFQEPAESLDPRLRIGETIDEPLRALQASTAPTGSGRSREAARRSASPRPARPLSGRAQRRPAAARRHRPGMITEPELVVLDEPTSALDPTARAEIIDLLIRIQRELGTAYLFISHDLQPVRYHQPPRRRDVSRHDRRAGPSAEAVRAPAPSLLVGLLSSVLLPNPRLKRRRATSALEGRDPEPDQPADRLLLAGRCPVRRRALPRRRCRRPRRSAPAIRALLPARGGRGDATETIDYFDAFQREAERILGAGVRRPPTAVNPSTKEDRTMGKLSGKTAVDHRRRERHRPRDRAALRQRGRRRRHPRSATAQAPKTAAARSPAARRARRRRCGRRRRREPR